MECKLNKYVGVIKNLGEEFKDGSLTPLDFIEGVQDLEIKDEDFNKKHIAAVIAVASLIPSISEEDLQKALDSNTYEEVKPLLEDIDLTILSSLEYDVSTIDKVIETLSNSLTIIAPEGELAFGKATIGADSDAVIGASEDAVNNPLDVDKQTILKQTSYNGNDGEWFNKQKIARELLAEGVKDGTPAAWGHFLSVYFPGAETIHSVEFIEYVNKKFYDKLFDVSVTPETSGLGFLQDINEGITLLKLNIARGVRNNSNPFSGAVPGIPKNADEAATEIQKNKYFAAILNVEFDFLIPNLIKVIKIDKEKTAEINREDINEKSLNKSLLAAAKTAETGITDDTSGPRNIVYGVNTANTKNQSWGDETVNPYNTKTAFVINFMSLIHAIKDDGNGVLTSGRRLTYNDYRNIAPLLAIAEKRDSGLKERLQVIMGSGSSTNKGEIGSIARALYYHLFSEADFTIDGKAKRSLTTIYNKEFGRKGVSFVKTVLALNSNADIISAVTEGLISVHHDKFVRTENGITKVTTPLSLKMDPTLVDNAFAKEILSRRGYTKKKIASNLKKDGTEIRILTHANAQTGVSLEEVDSIAAIEHYSKVLHIGNFITRIQKGLEDTFVNDLTEVYNVLKPIFDSAVLTAAYNIKKQDKFLRYPGNKKKLIRNNSFARVPTSAILFAPAILTALDSMFKTDVTQQVSIGGSRRSATTVGNRNAFLIPQVARHTETLKKAGKLDSHYSPFIFNTDTEVDTTSKDYIPTAVIQDRWTKASMKVNGKSISIQNWTEAMRYNHMYIEELLLAPEKYNVFGTQVFLQPVGFSDKGDPDLVLTAIDNKNLLNEAPGALDALKYQYIAYQKKKADYLQKQLIEKLTLYVGGNYRDIKAKIEAQRGEYLTENLWKAQEVMRLENELEEIALSKSDEGVTTAKTIIAALPFITKASAEKETGGKVGRGKDIGLTHIAGKKKGVQQKGVSIWQASDAIRADYFEGTGVTARDIGNTIIDILIAGGGKEYLDTNAVSDRAVQIRLSLRNLKSEPDKVDTVEYRIQKLEKLRELLVSKRYELMEDEVTPRVNMTKLVNILLDDIKIKASWVKFSDSVMNDKADYITMGGSHLLLKPHMGVRAEAYAADAWGLVDSALLRHRTAMKKLGVSKIKIEETLTYLAKIKGHNKLIRSAEKLYDRAYLIHGIYSHSLKTLMISDESFFKGNYINPETGEEYDNIAEYYKIADGLGEQDSMITAQSKRSGSILTGGSSNAVTSTYSGVKREAVQDNLAAFLIMESTGIKPDEVITYSFKSLYNKSAAELEAMGILIPFLGGNQLVTSNGFTAMKVKFGNEIYTVNNSTEAWPENANAEKFKDAFINLLNNVEKNSREDNVTRQRESPKEFIGSIDIDLEYQGLNYSQLETLFNKPFEHIKLPDYFHSMMLTEPISNLNLLNKMNREGFENSDGIQIMHSLTDAIKKIARGRKFGSYTTANYEADKMISNTIDYLYGEHGQNKNSMQNIFSFQQMERLGGVGLWNAFNAMNTAIDFPKQTMRVPVIGIDSMPHKTQRTEENFKNLKELMDYFQVYARNDESVWYDIANVLMHYPINLNSFVGYLVVPSNQKTAHKKFNSYDEVFDDKGIADKAAANIDFIGNEYTFEILTKEHEYDVTKNSKVTILSQLINSISMGGMTTDEALKLQQALQTMMDMKGVQFGKKLIANAAKLYNISHGQNRTDMRIILDRLESGVMKRETVARAGEESVPFTEEQNRLYSETLRVGAIDLIESAFPEGVETTLIQDFLSNPESAFELPIHQKKIINTLMSAFITNTVKTDIAGFQGVVTVAHKAALVFNTVIKGSPDKTVRRTRGAYIKYALKYGLEGDPDGGRVVTYDPMKSDPALKAEIDKNVIPLDAVRRFTKIQVEQPDGTFIEQLDETQFILVKNFSIDLTDPRFVYEFVFTPDTQGSTGISAELAYLNLKDTELVRLNGIKINGADVSGVRYKWFVDELFNLRKDELREAIASGKLTVDKSESYSLAWYKFTNMKGLDITEHSRYKDAYRKTVALDQMNKDKTKTPAEKARAARAIQDASALLKVELQRKVANPNGGSDNMWSTTPPEVVLPNFVKHLYGMQSGDSLYDIIGQDGQDVANTVRYLTGSMAGKPFIEIFTPFKNDARNRKALLNKFKLGETLFGYDFTEVIRLLNFNNTPYINDTIQESITEVLSKMKARFLNKAAKSFLSMLDVVLARIPGQTKQSGFTARVIEFMDAQGNMAMAPTEHLFNTGGDLDIDTLTILTKAISRNGLLPNLEDYQTKGGNVFDQAKLEEDLATGVKNMTERITELLTLTNKGIEEDIEALRNNTKLKDDDRENKIKSKERAIYTEEKIARLVKQGVDTVTSQFTNVINNAVFTSISEALNNVDAAVEINTPISMSIFDHIIENLMRDETYRNDRAAKYNGEDYTYIRRSEEEAAQGKEGIGLYATVLKIYALIQADKLVYDNKKTRDGKTLKYKGKDIKHPFEFKKPISITYRKGTKVITAFRTTYADLDENALNKDISQNILIQDALLDVGVFEEERGLLTDNLVNVFTKKWRLQNANSSKGEMADFANNMFDLDISFPNYAEAPAIFRAKLGEEGMLNHAYLNVIGKKNTADIGSEFLSAATDNAKELILGKIRSNPITVSLISTMLLVGFDVDTTIAFLYDPSMKGIIKYLDVQKAKGLSATLSYKKLKDAGKLPYGPYGESIKTLLALSNDIGTIRSVRSLIENFKIFQYDIDKIFDSISNPTALYEAIRADDITMVPANKGRDNKLISEINPAMAIFLHPQSRSVYVKAYELKYVFAPVVNKRLALLSRIGKNEDGFGSTYRTEQVYKNADNYIDGLIIDDFFRDARTGPEGKDKYKGHYYDFAGDGKKKTVELGTLAGRELFVDTFAEYVDETIEQIKNLGGNSSLFNALGGVRVFGASNVVYGIPSLANSYMTEVEIQTITSGIAALLTETGNKALDDLNMELYNNLALYAYIVGKGKNLKGSMLDLFDPINLKVSEFLASKDEAYYNDMFFRTTAGLTLLRGDIPTEDALKEAKASKSTALNLNEDPNQPDPNDMYNHQEPIEEYFPDEARYDDMPIDNGYVRAKTEREKISLVSIHTKPYTIQELFTVKDERLLDAVFLGRRRAEDVAYRVFKTGLPEASSGTRTIRFKEIPGISSDLLSDMENQGRQIGFDTTFNLSNNPAAGGSRVLAFMGTKDIQGIKGLDDEGVPVMGGDTVSMYKVLHADGTTSDVAGPHITEQDDDILLHGNVIEPFTSLNSDLKAEQEQAQEKALRILGPISETDLIDNTGVIVGPKVLELFGEDDFLGNELLIAEAKIIGLSSSEVTNIMQITPVETKDKHDARSFNAFNSTTLFPQASKFSRAIFIPGHTNGGEPGISSIANAQRLSIMDTINNLKLLDKKGNRDVLKLYGADIKIENAEYTEMIGGLNIVRDLIDNAQIRQFFDVEITPRYASISRKQDTTAFLTYDTSKEVLVAHKLNIVGDTLQLPLKARTSIVIKAKAILDGVIVAPYTIGKATIALDNANKTSRVMSIMLTSRTGVNKKHIFTIANNFEGHKNAVFSAVKKPSIKVSARSGNKHHLTSAAYNKTMKSLEEGNNVNVIC